METSTFVKQLSSNNRTVREKSLEALQGFLTAENAKQAKQLQYNKIWKGLYFAMWFSDKPRPQQRLANKLGELYGIYFNPKDNNAKDKTELTLNDKAFIKFSKGFWKIMCMEWYNIDRYRMDKYLLLMRRVFFNQLKYLQNREWNEILVDKYVEKVLKLLPLSGDKTVYNGIPIHVIDIILDEWERLLTEKDDEAEDDEEDDEDIEKDIIPLIKETPLVKFIKIFQDLKADIIVSKVLRDKIKEDLLQDERLVKWGIIEAKAPAVTEEESDVEAEDEDEEWAGF